MMEKILLLLLFVSGSLFARADDLRVGEVDVRRVGRQVIVSFTVNVPERYARNGKAVAVTPVLYSGELSCRLNEFSVTGKQYAARQRQKAFLRGVSAPGARVMNGTVFAYADTVAYEAWMGRSCSLKLETRDEGCGRSCRGGDRELGLVALSTPREPLLASVDPEPSASSRLAGKYPFLRLVGRDPASGRGTSVRFRVSRSEIDPDYSSNGESLQHILEAIAAVGKDDRASLEKISIAGYASPEGSREQNAKLSRLRAEALKEYIRREGALPAGVFEITAGGEDWNGLRELVSESDMPYRAEVLAILDTEPEAGREARLKALAGGRPYRGMLDLLYPRLCDACYINVWYAEKPDKTAERVNAAAAEMAEQRYDSALGLLREVSGDSRAWNAIGVCHWYLGDTEVAAAWWRKAAENGDAAAAENMKKMLD